LDFILVHYKCFQNQTYGFLRNEDIPAFLAYFFEHIEAITYPFFKDPIFKEKQAALLTLIQQKFGSQKLIHPFDFSFLEDEQFFKGNQGFIDFCKSLASNFLDPPEKHSELFSNCFQRTYHEIKRRNPLAPKLKKKEVVYFAHFDREENIRIFNTYQITKTDPLFFSKNLPGENPPFSFLFQNEKLVICNSEAKEI